MKRVSKSRLLASDIMSRPLICLREGASMRKAASMMIEHAISGAAVVDGHGRPIGVLTKTDIVRYARDRSTSQGPIAAAERGTSLEPPSGPDTVCRWMTPQVFSVPATATAQELAREMLRRRIHRVFIRTARSGQLLGVVTTTDVLRRCLTSPAY